MMVMGDEAYCVSDNMGGKSYSSITPRNHTVTSSIVLES